MKILQNYFFKILIPMLVATSLGFLVPASAQDYEGPRMTYTYEGPPVTFQQIYDNPNDGQLNLNYARQQSARGDLLGAAAALERLLYNQPNWHSARLFYAAVLYRLDDKAAAAREMKLLEGRNLNNDQLVLYEDYNAAFQFAPPETAAAAIAGQVGVARKTSENVSSSEKPDLRFRNFQGRVGLAVRSDNNAGNALTDLGTSSEKRSDNSAILQGAIRATFPIGESGNSRVFGNINGQSRRHETYSGSDYDTLGASIGVFKEFGNKRLSAELKADRVDVSGERYLNQFGPKVSFAVKSNDDVRIDVSAGLYTQDFDALSFATGEDQRSGDKAIVLANISKRLNSNVTVGLSAGYERKDAKSDLLAYEGTRLGVSAERLLNNGVTLKGRLNLRNLKYEDTPIAGQSNRENRASLRLSASTPISNFTKLAANSETVSPVKIEAALNFNQRDFGEQRDDYDNAGFEVRLTWDF